MKLWQLVVRLILATWLGYYIYLETGIATIIFYGLLVAKDTGDNFFDMASGKLSDIAMKELEAEIKKFEDRINGKIKR